VDGARDAWRIACRLRRTRRRLQLCNAVVSFGISSEAKGVVILLFLIELIADHTSNAVQRFRRCESVSIAERRCRAQFASTNNSVSSFRFAEDILRCVSCFSLPPKPLLNRDVMSSDVPNAMLQLIVDCWATDAAARPSMAAVVDRFAQQIL
jgi:hypothetical protein